MEEAIVSAITDDTSEAKLTVDGVPDRPGVAATLFRRLSDRGINVDMIVQNISHGETTPTTDISFTVDKPDLLKTQKIFESLKQELGFREVISTEGIGKVSIVGVGMRSHPGVAAKMFETLARENINIEMISTSEIKISVVVNLAKGEAAVRTLHTAFIG